MERVGRLFIGLGFVWLFLVLLVGGLGGFDKPSAWIAYLDSVAGNTIISGVYALLAYLVVPIGLAMFLWDLYHDPVALWVKAAAPGLFIALYAFFLLAAMPDMSRSFFVGIESAVAPVVSLGGYGHSLEATAGWFLRFLAAVALLGGIPGIIGALVGLVAGAGSRR